MIAPKQITLTIDGKKCTGAAGDTILQIARANDIEIPTLCYLKNLSPWGGCRVCIVEVKGISKVVPACSTPAMDGSEIIAHSERLAMLRKNTIELLFSERNHICPFCASNKGDCDLQQRAYEHGMAAVSFPYLYPALPTDMSGKYFGLDHNRCILCTRCVRSCDELEGVHTLDIGHRGERNRVVVDMNASFGESDTCTMCGACVENCPTGALFDKSQVYRGKLHKCDQIKTTCTECPLGCGLLVYRTEGRIVNVYGDEDAPNGGHLCVKGRYTTWAETRQRITQPMLRDLDGQLKPATWDAATAAIKEALAKSPGWQTGLLLSPRASNEAAAKAQALANHFNRVATFVAPHEAAICTAPEPTADSLKRIDAADCIILLGVQPSRDHGVLAARVRTAVRKRGAKLLVFHARKSDLDQYADIVANEVSLERSFWKQVGETLAKVQQPVLVYGPQAMSAIGVTVLDRLIKTFEAKADGQAPSLVVVPRSTNSLGLTAAGIEPVEEVAPWIDQQPLNYLHIVAADEPDGGARLLDERHVKELLSHLECIVVQAAYPSALTELATIVLPSATWAEKTGTTTNFEGRALPLQPVLPLAGDAREDQTILENVYA